MTAMNLELEGARAEAKRARPRSGALIGAAVCRNRLMSAEGVRERLFALVFSNLVYPQIWEDPAVDLEALALDGDSRIITIASGGCNVVSYLDCGARPYYRRRHQRRPCRAQPAEARRARHLPDYEAFYRFFGEADTKANIAAFRRHILPHLDAATAAYWHGRHGHPAAAAHRAILPQFLSRRPARQLHRRQPSGRAAAWRQSAPVSCGARRSMTSAGSSTTSCRPCSTGGPCAGWSTGRPRSMGSASRRRSTRRWSAR